MALSFNFYFFQLVSLIRYHPTLFIVPNLKYFLFNFLSGDFLYYTAAGPVPNEYIAIDRLINFTYQYAAIMINLYNKRLMCVRSINYTRSHAITSTTKHIIVKICRFHWNGACLIKFVKYLVLLHQQNIHNVCATMTCLICICCEYAK